MNYIVLDFEFNQAFDFENNSKGVSEIGCTFEIIQIGAVKLDGNFNLVSNFNQLIKPTIYKKLHPYVSKITGFTAKDFKNSKSFIDVSKDFIEFLGTDYIFCSWGKADMKALFRNLIYYDIDIRNISNNYIDVQALASKEINNSVHSLVGLENACKHFNIKTNHENFHDAYYDAFYTKDIMLLLKPTKKNIVTFNYDKLLKDRPKYFLNNKKYKKYSKRKRSNKTSTKK